MEQTAAAAAAVNGFWTISGCLVLWWSEVQWGYLIQSQLQAFIALPPT